VGDLPKVSMSRLFVDERLLTRMRLRGSASTTLADVK
jgi:hypothetical protein